MSPKDALQWLVGGWPTALPLVGGRAPNPKVSDAEEYEVGVVVWSGGEVDNFVLGSRHDGNQEAV